jgi:hypothetical protein
LLELVPHRKKNDGKVDPAKSVGNKIGAIWKRWRTNLTHDTFANLPLTSSFFCRLVAKCRPQNHGGHKEK